MQYICILSLEDTKEIKSIRNSERYWYLEKDSVMVGLLGGISLNHDTWANPCHKHYGTEAWGSCSPIE